jgi:hypothetical protein
VLLCRCRNTDHRAASVLSGRSCAVSCEYKTGGAVEAGLNEIAVLARPLSAAVMSAVSPDRYRSGLVARRQRTAMPVRDVDGLVSRHGIAGRTVIPGLGGKCAHGWSRNAGAPVSITRDGRGIRIGLHCGARRGDAALPSHRGSCDHGCGDQRSRQKFRLGHSISPLDMKSQRRWLLFVNGEAIDSSK